MLKMYAIPNCDTVKKARAFLDTKKIVYEFIDFKKTPPTIDLVNKWIDFLGELPINKKGTTYRKLKEQFIELSPSRQIDFMIANSSMIKRPILENKNKTIAIGFDEEVYSGLKIG